jgi:hypothetical protein
MFTSFGDPVDQDIMRTQRLELYELPDYVPKIGKNNNYGFSEDEQLTETYTGMGFDINVHDQWAVESQGPIQDRTREVLAASDVGIIAYRKNLIKAIVDQQKNTQSGESLEGHQLPIAIDVIAPVDDWEKSWVLTDAARRKTSGWADTSLS